MPSKIKSKLLIITVLTATQAVLFAIAPATAEMYSLIFLGISLFLSILAWNNARGEVVLQYKVSSFIGLSVFIFASIFAAIAHIAIGGMNYVMVAVSGIVAVRCLALLFGEYK